MKFLLALPALALTAAAPPATAPGDSAGPITTVRTAPPPAFIQDFPDSRSLDPERRMVSDDVPRIINRCDDLASHARDLKPEDRVRMSGPQELASLPPAEGYYAVWRTDAFGCPDPLKFDED